jgi:hypothetical protein
VRRLRRLWLQITQRRRRLPKGLLLLLRLRLLLLLLLLLLELCLL